jgi:hypothetical protein
MTTAELTERVDALEERLLGLEERLRELRALLILRGLLEPHEP